MEGESIIDENMSMLTTSIAPGNDVMADLHGFLEKRKRDRNMQRNTMES